MGYVSNAGSVLMLCPRRNSSKSNSDSLQRFAKRSRQNPPKGSASLQPSAPAPGAGQLPGRSWPQLLHKARPERRDRAFFEDIRLMSVARFHVGFQEKECSSHSACGVPSASIAKFAGLLSTVAGWNSAASSAAAVSRWAEADIL